jgi:hypothetical protein
MNTVKKAETTAAMKLRFAVAVQLLERLNDGRQHGHATGLRDAIHVEQLNHQRHAVLAGRRDPRPIGRLQGA